jgi:hypothetical protein
LDLKGFSVLRRIVSDTAREFTKITPALISSKISSFTDASVQSGRGYEYVVTAVDSSDNSSKRSAPKLMYVSGSENLAIPQLLTADYDSSS